MAARLIVHNDTEFDYTGGWTIWFSLLFKKGTWDENTIITDAWLAVHPDKIERVIFNVFKDEDKEYYEQELY